MYSCTEAAFETMRFILMFKYLLIENYQARLLNAKALSEYLTLLVSTPCFAPIKGPH